jgi:hypothetical protein
LPVRRLAVGVGQRADPARVGAGELEQDAREFLARIGWAAVLPVDDAYSAVRGGQDVVGPQVAVTGLNQLRRLDPGLQRDQLISQIGQPAGERRSRLNKLLDQMVPAVGANRFVIPRVQRAEVSGWNAVNGGHDRAHPGWVEPGIGGPQVDPLINPDLPAGDGREHASLGSAPHSAAHR